MSKRNEEEVVLVGKGGTTSGELFGGLLITVEEVRKIAALLIADCTVARLDGNNF